MSGIISYILNLFKRSPTPLTPKIQEKPMGITLKELLMNKYELKDLPAEAQGNIMTLLERINKVRDAYGKPMKVTSGFRSMDDHKRIYEQKGIKVIPLKSKHLYGQAVDIYDPNKELQAWILQNVALMESIGLWMEDFSATPNWCHCQIVPPASGKRFFKP